MKSIKVSVKLLCLYIAILLLLATGIVTSFLSLTNIRKQVEALNNGPFVVKNAADTVNKTFEAMQMSVFRAISNDSQDITKEAITDAKNSAVIIQEQLVLLKQNALGDTDTISKLEKNLTELAQMQEHVLALAAQNKNLEAAEYMEANNIPAIKEAQLELEHFIQAADAKEIELIASLRQTQKHIFILLISFGIASLLFSIGIGTYLWQLQRKVKQNMINPV